MCGQWFQQQQLAIHMSKVATDLEILEQAGDHLRANTR